MMFGVVNNICEATIKVAVGRIGSPKVMVNAVIDTGFTSFLSLPSSMIESLELPWSCLDFGTLGDGSEAVFEMYTASVIWDGQIQIVDVAASEAEPLVGMSLLYGYDLRIQAIEGGIVSVQALSELQ
ncbi:MAG: clan AA aspartic protease [Acaryochloridaceae cyanobacterium RU_4_10]|nr:clan AA aspartic protease [Acaryochloridaceae cyanobacterium RU_4_10]